MNHVYFDATSNEKNDFTQTPSAVIRFPKQINERTGQAQQQFSDRPEYIVPIWNQLNPQYQAKLVKVTVDSKKVLAYTTPYIKSSDASPAIEEIQSLLIDIYMNHGRIILDAWNTKNFIKTKKGEVICIDVGTALKLTADIDLAATPQGVKPVSIDDYTWQYMQTNAALVGSSTSNQQGGLKQLYDRVKSRALGFSSEINQIKISQTIVALLYLQKHYPDVKEINFLKNDQPLMELLAHAYYHYQRVLLDKEALNIFIKLETSTKEKIVSLIRGKKITLADAATGLINLTGKLLALDNDNAIRKHILVARISEEKELLTKIKSQVDSLLSNEAGKIKNKDSEEANFFKIFTDRINNQNTIPDLLRTVDAVKYKVFQKNQKLRRALNDEMHDLRRTALEKTPWIFTAESLDKKILDIEKSNKILADKKSNLVKLFKDRAEAVKNDVTLSPERKISWLNILFQHALHNEALRTEQGFFKLFSKSGNTASYQEAIAHIQNAAQSVLDGALKDPLFIPDNRTALEAQEILQERNGRLSQFLWYEKRDSIKVCHTRLTDFTNLKNKIFKKIGKDNAQLELTYKSQRKFRDDLKDCSSTPELENVLNAYKNMLENLKIEDDRLQGCINEIKKYYVKHPQQEPPERMELKKEKQSRIQLIAQSESRFNNLIELKEYLKTVIMQDKSKKVSSQLNAIQRDIQDEKENVCQEIDDITSLVDLKNKMIELEMRIAEHTEYPYVIPSEMLPNKQDEIRGCVISDAQLLTCDEAIKEYEEAHQQKAARSIGSEVSTTVVSPFKNSVAGGDTIVPQAKKRIQGIKEIPEPSDNKPKSSRNAPQSKEITQYTLDQLKKEVIDMIRSPSGGPASATTAIASVCVPSQDDIKQLIATISSCDSTQKIYATLKDESVKLMLEAQQRNQALIRCIQKLEAHDPALKETLSNPLRASDSETKTC